MSSPIKSVLDIVFNFEQRSGEVPAKVAKQLDSIGNTQEELAKKTQKLSDLQGKTNKKAIEDSKKYEEQIKKLSNTLEQQIANVEDALIKEAKKREDAEEKRFQAFVKSISIVGKLKTEIQNLNKQIAVEQDPENLIALNKQLAIAEDRLDSFEKEARKSLKEAEQGGKKAAGALDQINEKLSSLTAIAQASGLAIIAEKLLQIGGAIKNIAFEGLEKFANLTQEQRSVEGLAQVVGTTVEEITALRTEVAKFGGDFGNIRGAFSQFSGILGDALIDPATQSARQLRVLKVNLDEVRASANPFQEALRQVAENTKGATLSLNEARAAALAFGEDDFSKIIPALNNLGEAFERIQRRGLIITPEQSKELQGLGDSIAEISNQVEGLTKQVLIGLAPQVKDFANQLIRVFDDPDTKKGIEGLKILLQSLFSTVSTLTKGIIEFAVGIGNVAEKINNLLGLVDKNKEANKELTESTVKQIQANENLVQTLLDVNNAIVSLLVSQQKLSAENDNQNAIKEREINLRKLQIEQLRDSGVKSQIEANAELRKLDQELLDFKIANQAKIVGNAESVIQTLGSKAAAVERDEKQKAQAAFDRAKELKDGLLALENERNEAIRKSREKLLFDLGKFSEAELGQLQQQNFNRQAEQLAAGVRQQYAERLRLQKEALDKAIEAESKAQAVIMQAQENQRKLSLLIGKEEIKNLQEFSDQEIQLRNNLQNERNKLAAEQLKRETETALERKRQGEDFVKDAEKNLEIINGLEAERLAMLEMGIAQGVIKEKDAFETRLKIQKDFNNRRFKEQKDLVDKLEKLEGNSKEQIEQQRQAELQELQVRKLAFLRLNKDNLEAQQVDLKKFQQQELDINQEYNDKIVEADKLASTELRKARQELSEFRQKKDQDDYQSAIDLAQREIAQRESLLQVDEARRADRISRLTAAAVRGEIDQNELIRVRLKLEGDSLQEKLLNNLAAAGAVTTLEDEIRLRKQRQELDTQIRENKDAQINQQNQITDGLLLENQRIEALAGSADNLALKFQKIAEAAKGIVDALQESFDPDKDPIEEGQKELQKFRDILEETRQDILKFGTSVLKEFQLEVVTEQIKKLENEIGEAARKQTVELIKEAAAQLATATTNLTGLLQTFAAQTQSRLNELDRDFKRQQRDTQRELLQVGIDSVNALVKFKTEKQKELDDFDRELAEREKERNREIEEDRVDAAREANDQIEDDEFSRTLKLGEIRTKGLTDAANIEKRIREEQAKDTSQLNEKEKAQIQERIALLQKEREEILAKNKRLLESQAKTGKEIAAAEATARDKIKNAKSKEEIDQINKELEQEKRRISEKNRLLLEEAETIASLQGKVSEETIKAIQAEYEQRRKDFDAFIDNEQQQIRDAAQFKADQAAAEREREKEDARLRREQLIKDQEQEQKDLEDSFKEKARILQEALDDEKRKYKKQRGEILADSKTQLDALAAQFGIPAAAADAFFAAVIAKIGNLNSAIADLVKNISQIPGANGAPSTSAPTGTNPTGGQGGGLSTPTTGPTGGPGGTGGVPAGAGGIGFGRSVAPPSTSNATSASQTGSVSGTGIPTTTSPVSAPSAPSASTAKKFPIAGVPKNKGEAAEELIRIFNIYNILRIRGDEGAEYSRTEVGTAGKEYIKLLVDNKFLTSEGAAKLTPFFNLVAGKPGAAEARDAFALLARSLVQEPPKTKGEAGGGKDFQDNGPVVVDAPGGPPPGLPIGGGGLDTLTKQARRSLLRQLAIYLPDLLRFSKQSEKNPNGKARKNLLKILTDASAVIEKSQIEGFIDTDIATQLRNVFRSAKDAPSFLGDAGKLLGIETTGIRIPGLETNIGNQSNVNTTSNTSVSPNASSSLSPNISSSPSSPTSPSSPSLTSLPSSPTSPSSPSLPSSPTSPSSNINNVANTDRSTTQSSSDNSVSNTNNVSGTTVVIQKAAPQITVVSSGGDDAVQAIIDAIDANDEELVKRIEKLGANVIAKQNDQIESEINF